MFTAGVELRHQRHLTVSFLHHMAVQRNVRNPFENSDVVGITNYLDIALQMKTDLQPGRPSAPAPADWVSVPASAAALSESGGNTMRLGVAWQANKNVLLKGRVGLDGVAAAAVVKGWWQPSFTLGVAVSKGLDGTPARMGLTAAVETYTKLRQVLLRARGWEHDVAVRWFWVVTLHITSCSSLSCLHSTGSQREEHCLVLI